MSQPPRASAAKSAHCALVGCSMIGSVELEIETAGIARTAITICEHHLAELCAARRAAPETAPPSAEVEAPRRRFRRG
jgi:hypothetical protein